MTRQGNPKFLPAVFNGSTRITPAASPPASAFARRDWMPGKITKIYPLR